MPDLFDDFSVVTDDPDAGIEGVLSQVERAVRGAFDRIQGGVRPLVEGIEEVEANFTHLDDTIRRSQFMQGVESGLAKEIDEVANSLTRWRGVQAQVVRDSQQVVAGLEDMQRAHEGVSASRRSMDQDFMSIRKNTYEALRANQEYVRSAKQVDDAEMGMTRASSELSKVRSRIQTQIENGKDANQAYADSYQELISAQNRLSTESRRYREGVESVQKITQEELPKFGGRWSAREGGVGAGARTRQAGDAYDDEFRRVLERARQIEQDVKAVVPRIESEAARGIVIDPEHMQRGVRDVGAAVEEIVGAVKSGRQRIQSIGNLMLMGDVDPGEAKKVQGFYDFGARAAGFFTGRLEQLNTEADAFRPNISRMNDLLGDLLTGTRAYVREARSMEDIIEGAGTAAGLSSDQLQTYLTKVGEFRRLNVEAGLGGVRLVPGARGTGVTEDNDVRARGTELQTLYAQWDEQTERLQRTHMGRAHEMAEQAMKGLPQIHGRVMKILGDVGEGEDNLSKLQPHFQGLERNIGDLYQRMLVLNTAFGQYSAEVTQGGQATDAQLVALRSYGQRIKDVFDGVLGLNEVLDIGKTNRWAGSIREMFVPLDGLIKRLEKVQIEAKQAVVPHGAVAGQTSKVPTGKIPDIKKKVEGRVKDVSDKLTGRATTRAGFVGSGDAPFVKQIQVDIPQYKPEVDLSEGKAKVDDIERSIKQFHARMAEILRISEDEILEVSTASADELGRQLSAFNLKVRGKSGQELGTVESLYQGSKVFEKGGPYKDLYGKKSFEAKGDERLKKSGKLTGFDFGGRKFDAGQDHNFYNWLYLNSLVREMPDIGSQIGKYKGFTDIYGKSGNAMQSEAVAIASSLAKQGKLTPEFLADPQNLRAETEKQRQKQIQDRDRQIDLDIGERIFEKLGIASFGEEIRAAARQTDLFRRELADAKRAIGAEGAGDSARVQGILDRLFPRREKPQVRKADAADYIESTMGARVPGGEVSQFASALMGAVEQKLRKDQDVQTRAEDAERAKGILSKAYRDLVDNVGTATAERRLDERQPQRTERRETDSSAAFGIRGSDRDVEGDKIGDKLRSYMYEHSEITGDEVDQIRASGRDIVRQTVDKADVFLREANVVIQQVYEHQLNAVEKIRRELGSTGQRGDEVQRKGKSQKTFGLKGEHEEGLLREAVRMNIVDKLYQAGEGTSVPDVMRGDKFKDLVKGKESIEDLLGVLYPQIQKVLDDRYKGIEQFKNLVGLSKKRIDEELKGSGLQGKELDLVKGKIANVYEGYRKQIDAAKAEVRKSDAYQFLYEGERVTPSQRVVSKILDRKAQRDVEEETRQRGFKPDLAGFSLDVSGNQKLLDELGVAIVGNRKASEVGLKVATRLGELLAQRGVNVVSGLASGVDTAAHVGALKAGGTTTMVPASGLEKMRIAQHLAPMVDGVKTAFVSMFKRDTPFTGQRAMARNELVRALSESVVVVEAEKARGGTYEMGRRGLEEGKRVYAISPDDLPAGRAEGNRALIRQGAQEVRFQDLKEQGVGIFTKDRPDRIDIRKWLQPIADREKEVLEFFEDMRRRWEARKGKLMGERRGVDLGVGEQLEIDFDKVGAFRQDLPQLMARFAKAFSADKLFRRIELSPDEFGRTAPFVHAKAGAFWDIPDAVRRGMPRTGFSSPPWGDIEARGIESEHWFTQKGWDELGKKYLENALSKGLKPKVRRATELSDVGYYDDTQAARVLKGARENQPAIGYYKTPLRPEERDDVRGPAVGPEGMLKYVDGKLNLISDKVGKQVVQVVKSPTKTDPGGQLLMFDAVDASVVKHVKSIRKDFDSIRSIGGLDKLFGKIDLSDERELLKIVRSLQTVLQKLGVGKLGASGSGSVVKFLGEGEFSEIQQRVRRVVSSVDSLQSIITTTGGDTAYLSTKVSGLDESFGELLAVVNRLYPRLEDLDAIMGTKRSLIPTTKELKDRVDRLGTSLLGLSGDASRTGDKMDSELDTPLTRIIGRIEQLRGAVGGTELGGRMLSQMSPQLDRLSANLSELETRQAGLNRLMESGDVSADVLRQSYRGIESTIESVGSNVRSLSGQLQQIEQNTDDATKDTDEYKDAVREIRVELSRYEQQLESVENSLKDVGQAAKDAGDVKKKSARQLAQEETGIDVSWRDPSVWSGIPKNRQKAIISERDRLKSLGISPWWDEPPSGVTQTGRDIREDTRDDRRPRLFSKEWFSSGSFARADKPQEGDYVSRPTRDVGGMEVPDFRRMGFVDLFASMEIFERIFHRMQMVVDITAQFGFQMARVGGITGTSAVEFERLTNFARKMGETTIFSATESAEAMEELAKVGFSASSIISTLPAVLNVAAAEGMKLAQAAEILAANLKAFEMSSSESARLSNVLAAASMRTAATMEDFGVGLRTVATFAHTANVSVEETVALLGKLADAGLTPRRASVALRALIQQMQRLERSGAQRELSRMGLTMADIDPKVVGLTTAIARLDEKIKETGADADDIFTVRASHAFQILSQVGQDSMRSLTSAITGTNAAADLAARQMDTFQGALQRGRSVFEEFQISLGIGFEPIIRFFINAAAAGMKFVINMDDGLKQLIATLVLFTATGVASGQVFAMFKFSGGLLIDQFKSVGAAAIDAASKLRLFVVAHPYIAAAAAIGIAIAGIIGWVRKRNAEEVKIARLRRERLREEIRIREDLVSKIEQHARKREDTIFTTVEQEQIGKAAARVGTLKVEFDSLGRVIADTHLELVKLLEVMRKGDLEFPALKKFEEAVKQAGQTFLTTAEMVQIVEFMEDMRGFKIDIGDGVFASLTVEFNKLNEAIFKTSDGVQLTAEQTERVLQSMRRFNAVGEATLARGNITEGVLNRLDVMQRLAESLARPFEYGDPLARPGQESVGRSESDFLSDIKDAIFRGSDLAQEEGRRYAIEIGEQAGLDRIQIVAEGLRSELRALVNEQIRLAEKWGLTFDRNQVIQLIDALVSEQAALERGQLMRDIATGAFEPRMPDPAIGEALRGIAATAGDVVGSLRARTSMLDAYKRMEGYELPSQLAEVLDVVDGDTLKVRIDGVESEIRIRGIDTRESRTRDEPEPFAKEAAAALKAFVGEMVYVGGFRGQRTFGRDVATVQNLGRQDVSEYMVGEGLARVTEFPAEDRQKLLRIQQEAMAKGLNIWGEGQERFWSPAEKHYMKLLESQVASADNLQSATQSLADEAKRTQDAAAARLSGGAGPIGLGVAASSVSGLMYRRSGGVPTSPTMPSGVLPNLDDFAFEKAGQMGLLAEPVLDRARRIQSEGWFRNKHASRDLEFLVTDLSYYLEALALIMEGKDSTTFLGDMKPEDLKKEIKQIESAIRRKIVEIDKFQKKEYAKAFRVRLEFLSGQIGEADSALIKHIRGEFARMADLLNAEDWAGYFEDADTVRGLRQSLESAQETARKRREAVLTGRVKDSAEAWVQTLDSFMLDVAGKDPAGLLDMVSVLGNYSAEIRQQVQRLQQQHGATFEQRWGGADALDKLNTSIQKHLNTLFAQLDMQVGVGLGQADPIDIRGRVESLVGFYDMLAQFTDVLEVDDLHAFQDKIAKAVGRLSGAELAAYADELENVGFAGLQQRIQAVDLFKAGLDSLRQRLASIPQVMWDQMVAEILPKIDATRDTLTGDMVTKLQEGIGKRLERDPSLKLDELLEPYLDLVELLDADELASFIAGVGGDVDEIKGQIESQRRDRFKTAVERLGTGLDNLDSMMVGMGEIFVERRLAQLVNMLENEAKRRAAAAGDPSLLGVEMSGLAKEFSGVFAELGQALRNIRLQRRSAQLASQVNRVSRVTDEQLGGMLMSMDEMRAEARRLGITLQSYIQMHSRLISAVSEEVGRRAADVELRRPEDYLPTADSLYRFEMGFPGAAGSGLRIGERVAGYMDGFVKVLDRRLANDLEVYANSAAGLVGKVLPEVVVNAGSEMQLSVPTIADHWEAVNTEAITLLGVKLREGAERVAAVGVSSYIGSFEKIDKHMESEGEGEVARSKQFREMPFFKSPPDYEGYFFEREKRRIKREKAIVKDEYAREKLSASESLVKLPKGYKERLGYEHKSRQAQLDLELEYIKQFQMNQDSVRESLSAIQKRLESMEKAGGLATFGETGHGVFEDLLQIEAHLDLSQHLSSFGDTIDQAANVFTTFMRRMDQSAAMINLFNRFIGKEAPANLQVFAAALSGGIASLAAGEGGGGFAASVGGGILGGVAGGFLGDPLAGAQLGSSLGSALFNAFTDKDELEQQAADSMGVQSGVGSRVDIRNTTVHIGSVVHENHFEVTEEVDVERISEELAQMTEGDLREILV